MAKGRKLMISRSDRLLGSGYSYGHDPATVTESSELSEEDVWSMVEDMFNGGDDHSMMNGSHGEWSPRAAAAAAESMSVRSRRRVPQDERHVGGLSLAFDDSAKTVSSRILHQFRTHNSMSSPRGRHMATSAPVNVPDWSKIYRVDSVESLHDSDNDMNGCDSEMVPPHEYLAREYRKMAANSVFEGIGRTLKGRDLSQVRDAVWSQTGFYG